MDYLFLNISLPEKHNLCCMVCKIIINENDPVMIYPDYYRYKLKIRKILDEIPAIAAPENEEFKTDFFYIIVTKKFFTNFNALCKALNIEIVYHLDPIMPSIYNKCLLYTVEYDLESRWSKVGQYFVKSQSDFFTSLENVKAVKLNIINFNNNKMVIFNMYTFDLKIPFLRLDASLQRNFQQPVHVLPSLEVANVLGISKRIRKHCLFKDYEDLRAFWKNMHGYILPDYEEKFLFYDIKFPSSYESSDLIYPNTCLLSGPLEVTRLKKEETLEEFKIDLNTKITGRIAF